MAPGTLTTSSPSFDVVVFGGGGCRCFWQAGFWSVVAPAIDLRPRQVLGASAGAAFACAALAGRIDTMIESFTRRCARNPRNVYPSHLVRRRPIFPHEEIYRGTIFDVIDDAALARLHGGPELRILVARPPGGRVLPTLLAGFAAYKLDTSVRRTLHPSTPRRLGFAPEFVGVRECGSIPDLADLILQSSCLPPLLPIYRRSGAVVIDGAIVGQALVDATPAQPSTLVMLTRPHRTQPDNPRTYVQPSCKPPIAMWDYASPELIGPTFDLGRRDGEAFLAARASASATSSSPTI